MTLTISFYSYFKDLAGCATTSLEVAEGTTREQLLDRLMEQFPSLAPMRKSALLAVGVDYFPRDYCLKPGDIVALFPPVQGG